MAERKPQWPEVGDLVTATIESFTDYGAYANLEVSAENYKRAEEILQKVPQCVQSNIAKAGGHCTFRRDK
jgi:translation initiation factor 2 alpha subunit (eIF-2alpha)